MKLAKIPTRHTPDEPKPIIKEAHKKALRRWDREEIQSSLTAEQEHQEPDTHAAEIDPEYQLAPFAVLVYSDDGDGYPDYFPHSYHKTRKDAECEIAWLEHINPGTTTSFWSPMIIPKYWVPYYDAHRIPK